MLAVPVKTGAPRMPKKTVRRKASKATRKATRKTTPRTARTARVSAVKVPGPKQQFLDAFRREHQTTLKVIHALPADQGHFQPHPRSQNAKALIWTFTIEQALTVNALKGTLKMPPTFPPVPETLAEAIAAFERAAAETIDTVKRSSDAHFDAKSPFMGGPGKFVDFPNVDLVWLMLNDQIHHRG